jgi:hypothetical protein
MQYPFRCHRSRNSSPRLYRIPPMVLVGPPGPICGALVEGPTELDSLEQPARSTRGAKSRNIRTTGSFFCNIPFVRNTTDEWLYCSDIRACIAGAYLRTMRMRDQWRMSKVLKDVFTRIGGGKRLHTLRAQATIDPARSGLVPRMSAEGKNSSWISVWEHRSMRLR